MTVIRKSARALAIASALFVATQGVAHETGEASPAHDHAHDHAHAHDHDDQIYKGYFEDAQVVDRPLSDWQGEWQSVYPLLQDGTLDPVMAHKAEHGDKSADEYRAYYDTGYASDVNGITIDAESVIFRKQDGDVGGRYVSDGHEILTYDKGNRGVRFIFRKVEGDEAAPGFIQFSDHRIAPSKSDHYHLYWGDDRAKALGELTNWPTFYPASLTAAQIVEDMIAH